MQERITPSGEEFAELVVQFDAHHGHVGIGLEPRSEVPSAHFIDALYGEKSSLARIGELFAERMMNARKIDVHAGYRASNAEHVLNEQLGRFILDAVTGSNSFDGVWTWFERPQINRLIRILRKARDITFGRDE